LFAAHRFSKDVTFPLLQKTLVLNFLHNPLMVGPEGEGAVAVDVRTVSLK